MNDNELSPQQLQVIDALSRGVNLTTAAEQAGIHRNTINHWRQNLPLFQQALAQSQYDRAMLFREKADDLVDLAIENIRGLLTNPETPPSVRLRAALAILNTAITPPLPKKENKTPNVHNSAQSTPSGQNINKEPSPAATIKPQIMHNSAQSMPPHSPGIGGPKVGRNEPGPCRSGKKYKRGCLDQPLSQSQPAAA